ncbi:MAG: aquaporin [Flavobacteriales bacterium]|nr:aquaporin [Flavobacteriales bacterium]
MKKYWAELMGTYIMVFAGTGAIIVNDVYGSVSHLGIGLTFGLVVMAVIYSIGSISGAHINPAVSIAFWVSKRFSGKEVLPYIISQFFGAILASLTLSFMFPQHELLGATLPAGSWEQSFVMEFILTFILMFVILLMSEGSKEVGVMTGFAVGMVVAFEAIFAGPVSGASMNPARSLAPALVSGHLTHLWLYILATTLGASASVFAVRLIKDSSSDNHTS